MKHPLRFPHYLMLTSVTLIALVTAIAPELSFAQDDLATQIDRRAAQVESKVIAWRQDIHQHPELGNREFRTAELVAAHLKSLGMEVQTGVAHTGVVGLLRGGQPGPVVALRADMDALPVTEAVDLPFASKAKGTYEGKEVGVMHACGHDAHVAILMGVAEVLSGMKAQLPGTVKFIFQPSEEGAPQGEEGGAVLMVKEGVLENPSPAAIFGLHVGPNEVGKIGYRPGPCMASADKFRIVVHGRQTHGASPWKGVDPIVVAAQIILGLQTIESRQVDVTLEPSVLTIGAIHGGVRFNIIPDSVEMVGTIRTFDEAMREDIHQRLTRTAELIAQSSQASAQVLIEKLYPVTINDEKLTTAMLPTLRKVAGEENVLLRPKKTAAEDCSFYQQKIPGLFFFLGITPKGVDVNTAPPNHSPLFHIDESGLVLGVRALAHLAVDYMQENGGGKAQ